MRVRIYKPAYIGSAEDIAAAIEPAMFGLRTRRIIYDIVETYGVSIRTAFHALRIARGQR